MHRSSSGCSPPFNLQATGINAPHFSRLATPTNTEVYAKTSSELRKSNVLNVKEGHRMKGKNGVDATLTKKEGKSQ